jgi:epoxyqueuosine reductase
MITKQDVIDKAREIGFADVGICDASPFADHQKILDERRDQYDWIYKLGLDLSTGTDPSVILPGAKSIIVVLGHYYDRGFPPGMENHFGRCYLDDDRLTKDGLSRKVKAFRSFLRDAGIQTKIPFNLPHRVAAARAGLGTFGKNCLFYADRAVAGGSWTLPIAVVVDAAFEPDTPTVEVGCPDWCRNTCIVACPTGALKGPRKIDPRLCISYLTYFGEGLTPEELREPMGLWVYGCDHCQNVCPRNRAWLARSKYLPLNVKAAAMMPYFSLPALLHMDVAYYEAHIQPHMFYMPSSEIWRWQMNAARAMGNSLDEAFVPELEKAMDQNADERVAGMSAWALGRIGGTSAKEILEKYLDAENETLRDEVLKALSRVK